MKKLIRFTANWCAPCRSYAPVFESFINENQDVTGLTVDVDSNPTLAEKYNIRSIPSTALEVNGSFREVRTGVLSKEQLRSFIDN